ncbi:MAG: hypothetical protein A3I09_00640 [Deltaproteobacteria bacterium RIFCSPLOWO2_02_FULL_47_10]|nr:MAG: hypothetical protein A3I09_00640 [Deltaproteobacteria bacterium RIFCSPLOWO2_02_FULL_47_10]
MDYDVIIIGGGASGLMCAIEAGQRGRNVAVLEHSPSVGQKILVSGGGRCNFTNLNVSNKNYSSLNPDFCRSALAGFKPDNFTALMDRYNIKYYEKSAGQLFCEGSSRQIVSMLQAECKKMGVEIFLKCNVKTISHHGRFILKTDRGEYSAGALVIATGGLSYKNLGASGLGYDIAQQFGHSIIGLRPSLVPFTFNKTDRQRFSILSGLSFPVSLRFQDRILHGGMLFTHRGLSGPAILQASLYWDGKQSVTVDLLPDRDVLKIMKEERLAGCRVLCKNYLCRYLPSKLAGLLFGDNKQRLCDTSDSELKNIADKLHNWRLMPEGTEGYDTAEVTSGGINTDEISSKTFESKKMRGLYFIGEVLDVTGTLGGYNLHWAWASGFSAGQFV